MTLNDFHDILFNMQSLYSVILGIWAAYLTTREREEYLTGNFWGAIAVYSILAAVTLGVGLIMTAQGLQPDRFLTYFLYMLWLIIIMPGMFFSILRGRTDKSAAIAFSLLAFFNAAVSFSMMQRMLVTPWT